MSTNASERLMPGDRIQCLTGRESDCGKYYITKCRLVFGTIIDKGKYFATRRTWFMVQFDGYEKPQRVPDTAVEQLNLLDRLAEIPK